MTFILPNNMVTPTQLLLAVMMHLISLSNDRDEHLLLLSWQCSHRRKTEHAELYSPNVGSLLHPFKRTPFDVVSMRKCLTSSASRSPPNIKFITMTSTSITPQYTDTCSCLHQKYTHSLSVYTFHNCCV